MSGEMLAVLWTTVAVVLVTGAIGAMVLQAVRHRSLLLSIVVAALVPVAGVSAAVVLSYVLGRRVASGSRELTAAVRGLSAGSDGNDARGTDAPAGVRFSAPA